MELIDREALKKEYCDCCAASSDCIGSGCKIYNARCLIKDLPTVDAEPVRHGWWEKNSDLEWDTEYSCSLCGHTTHMNVMPDQRDNWIDDYCGGCGAKMDGDTK